MTLTVQSTFEVFIERVKLERLKRKIDPDRAEYLSAEFHAGRLKQLSPNELAVLWYVEEDGN